MLVMDVSWMAIFWDDFYVNGRLNMNICGNHYFISLLLQTKSLV